MAIKEAAQSTHLADRLLSRKFWVAVLGFAVLVYFKAYAEASAVLISFIAVQGVTDWKLGGDSYTNTQEVE